MRRILSLSLALLAFTFLPALAQQPAAPTGKIHGKVIDPTGVNIRPAPSASPPMGAAPRNTASPSPLQASSQAKRPPEPTPSSTARITADKMADSINNVKIRGRRGHGAGHQYDPQGIHRSV